MITGKDAISKEILIQLSKGIKVKEIPNLFSSVSLDQAKRLSRYHTMLLIAEDELDSKSFLNLQTLGLKSLVLAPLFKRRDWEGVFRK